MKFSKGSFLISYGKLEEPSFKEEQGWISKEDSQYGFYKKLGGWQATDIPSGTSICWRKTRKECATFIEQRDIQEKLARIREKEDYKKLVKKLEKYKEPVK